jgi:hypothetical protein
MQHYVVLTADKVTKDLLGRRVIRDLLGRQVLAVI